MNIPDDLLKYPLLMNNEQLIASIQQRYLRIPNIENMNRYELIDLYNRYCIPYQQRKSRDRSKITSRKSPNSSFDWSTNLNDIESRNCTDVVITSNDWTEGPLVKRIDNLEYFSSNEEPIILNSRKYLNSNGKWSKPPPDLLTCQMKRIKIDNVECKDVICINKRRMSLDLISTADCPPLKKDRKSLALPHNY